MIIMVLFIAFNGEYSDSLMEHLLKFYKDKRYNVTTFNEQGNETINHILNHQDLLVNEILQLKAYNRSNTYYSQDWNKYDLILVTGSIIDDYCLIQETEVPTNFIKKINQYYPIYDLYITIGNNIKENYKIHLNRQYNHHIIQNDENTFENIVKTIFDNLPRCNWCGRLFKPNKQNYKYCSRKCSKYSLEEQKRINSLNYYHKYKNVLSERQKGALGSKNANLHGTPDPNPFIELEKVRRAKKCLGLKSDLFK